MKACPRTAYSWCFWGNAALIALLLNHWGAVEVRGHAEVLTPLTGVAIVWLWFLGGLFSVLGISRWEDAIHRRNAAALTALCGALTGAAWLYAAGAFGEGEDYGQNVFCTGLGTLAWFGLWLVLELGGKVARSVAEERDLATGLRLAGCLLATSLILGRALAGNWHSAGETLRDFATDGWPAGLLTLVAVSVERRLRPSRAVPFPNWRTAGLAPALGYLAAAAGWLWHLGAWEGMPR